MSDRDLPSPSESLPGSSSAAVTLQLQNQLAALSPERLHRVFSVAEELREEDGVYFDPREMAPAHRNPADGFDLMPLVIDGSEWSRLERGLVQRLRAWNSFLRDIYQGQEILDAGVVPYEIVYADPNFHRGCARLPIPPSDYLQLTAFDLQQNARGQWLVVENHLGVAEGATYAMKKREIMRQVAPHLFDGTEILPIIDGP